MSRTRANGLRIPRTSSARHRHGPVYVSPVDTIRIVRSQIYTVRDEYRERAHPIIRVCVYVEYSRAAKDNKPDTMYTRDNTKRYNSERNNVFRTYTRVRDSQTKAIIII